MTMNQSGQYRVLLVDDDESVREYVCTILQQSGFDVLQATDGVDALTLFRERQGSIDILVTDIKMPRMTGIELVRAISTLFPGIPVVYISGEDGNQHLHNPEQHRVVLQKPFLPQAIVDAVGRVMPKSASHGYG
jgi:CheY-like chemotaxis protein